MPINIYMKLYDSIFLGTISYWAAIRGDRAFSCLSAVQNRAARVFMVNGRYTPNAVVMGDIGWESVIREWNSVINHWYRMRNMDITHLNFKVFI